MKKDSYFKELVLRLITGFAVLIGYPLFYMILAPITLHVSYFFFNIFMPSALVGTKIVTVMDSFELIPVLRCNFCLSFACNSHIAYKRYLAFRKVSDVCIRLIGNTCF